MNDDGVQDVSKRQVTFHPLWGQTEMKPDLILENKFHLSPVKH